MKKNIVIKIVLSSVIVFLTFSCANVRSFSINRVRHAEPRLANDLPLSSFTILGDVSGEGKVNSRIKSKKENRFEGDTGLYGSLDWDDAIYLNLAQDSMPAPRTPFDAALGNAIYNMIEAAEELKADVILFVRTKTQVTQKNGVQEVSVKVRGVAAKLK